MMMIQPHYASYPFITRKQKKIKIDINVPQDTSKWSADFQWKTSKVKVTVHQKTQQCHISGVCLLTGGGISAGDSGADCKLGLTIVRPNLLSTPEMLGNWTDGRISRRHSAPTSFLVLPTSMTRSHASWRHFFLFRIHSTVNTRTALQGFLVMC